MGTIGGIRTQGHGERLENAGDVFGKIAAHFLIRHLPVEPLAREFRHQGGRRGHSDIALDQHVLEVPESCTVELSGVDDRADRFLQPVRRARETGTQPNQPSLLTGRVP